MNTRKQLSRDDMLRSFVDYYNCREKLDVQPESMLATANEKHNLVHLYSKYMIWPSAFDRDPFQLPKVATFNKYT